MAYFLDSKITVYSLPKENSIFLCTHFNTNGSRTIEFLSARLDGDLYFYPLKRKNEYLADLQLDLSQCENIDCPDFDQSKLSEFEKGFDYSLLSYCNSSNILKFRCLNLFPEEVNLKDQN